MSIACTIYQVSHCEDRLGLELTIDMSTAFTILLVPTINENNRFLIVIVMAKVNDSAEPSQSIGVRST